MAAKSQINYWQGWNNAIDSVWQALTRDELVSTVTPDQERLRISLLELLRKLFADEDSLKFKPTNDELAEKYAVSPRTITNWRKAGCPFEDGQWGVLDWMAERRYVPASARAKFSRQLGQRTGEGLDDMAALSFRVKRLAEAVRQAGF